MARKKQPSIAEMQNRMQELAAEITKEKERMAGVMAKAFLTDEIAAKLGDRSDAELKRIMSMLTVHVDECVAALTDLGLSHQDIEMSMKRYLRELEQARRDGAFE